MKIMARDYVFERRGEVLTEGTFFYDADVLNKQMVDHAIRALGLTMDNSGLTQDAPCFFLPKAKADLLRASWQHQDIDKAIGVIKIMLE